MNGFFSDHLESVDSEIFRIIQKESIRQNDEIELIASENIVSKAVLEAQGSSLTNKYAEGYPGKRYYGGCQFVDEIEQLAIDRAKKLFSCHFCNVQPNSGSQMNQAVFLALLKPGDSFMGLDLNSGGHLTHGSSVNMSGKWFNAIPYGVSPETSLLDMDAIARIAEEKKPKLIIAGATAYSRIIDWKAFRDIADSINAFLMVDMAHIAGLVAAGQHPSPIPYAHVVTSTTHKSLRGPRGGIILTNDEDIAKKINMAVFPGLQGGPLMHIIAAKAVAFHEALQDSFKEYAKNIIKNAQMLSKTLEEVGVHIVSGGTDNHLMLVDLRPKSVTGKEAEEALGRVNITCNKNSIPFDPEKPFVTSGLRLGTPAATTRGFKEKEFQEVGYLIGEVLDDLHDKTKREFMEIAVRKKVLALTNRFPVRYL